MIFRSKGKSIILFPLEVFFSRNEICIPEIHFKTSHISTKNKDISYEKSAEIAILSFISFRSDARAIKLRELTSHLFIVWLRHPHAPHCITKQAQNNITCILHLVDSWKTARLLKKDAKEMCCHRFLVLKIYERRTRCRRSPMRQGSGLFFTNNALGLMSGLLSEIEEGLCS